jgi:hypothetical protein
VFEGRAVPHVVYAISKAEFEASPVARIAMSD